ncbi:lytic polysaccharide monooxygenase [Aaosphaeria arxii CBS 175.79]|uniref:lytic cellulose monooxygenase (C4-dehydrogenating) n=1 Tax=Aaosphaeria arxii CBS 175.79 TaxID=1450172 RepID=A0A6A5X6C7_9PLEO|nr:lytic polysaccharide monooxygenase [Aaosphaeria arxii CBS 175.79]KAF2008431.1 lytic polysaccharide monooxygenase [Aaosphaeria arxii CBS 175.79]
MTYLANCNGDCKTFKGDTGNVWVKIDQMAYDRSRDPAWASMLLMKQNATWTITVPPTLAPGDYVLRHEILGLQAASTRMGAQFYPSCAHLKVSGSGTNQLPAGVALPGAYDPDDVKGIHLHYIVDIEMHGMEYVAPGGEVWSAAAPQANGM